MGRTIVIGAGLIGASTAFALSQRNQDILILDQQSDPGRGASFANGGMLTPSMSDPWNAPGVWRDLLRMYGRPDAPMLLRTKALPGLSLWGVKFLGASTKRNFERVIAKNVRLGLFSLEVMSKWRREQELAYDGTQVGTVKIYRDLEALDQGVAKSETLRDLGIEHEVVATAVLAERFPALAPIQGSLVGGIHFPNDESGDSYKFTQELISRSQSLGAATRWGARVQRVLIKNNRVTGVKLENGEMLDAVRVVLATGAKAPKLAAGLGIGLAVKPVKGYSITFSGASIDPARRLNIPIVDDGLHAAVTPLGDRIRVAGTAEFTGFDTRLNHERLENLRHMLRELLPEQAPILLQNELDCWTNFRPMHADGAPIIGPSRVKGAYINTGHGHLGWTLAAGSGEALAREILGEKPAFDLSPYHPR